MEDPDLTWRSTPELPHGELGLQIQADKGLQESLLPGLYPLFAGSLHDFPEGMRVAFTNTVLLRRMVAVIDGARSLSSAGRHRSRRLVIHAVEGKALASELRDTLCRDIGNSIPAAERELLRHADCVVRVTLSLSQRHRLTVCRYIRRFCAGSTRFERLANPHGLASFLMTRLLCDSLPGIANRRRTLLGLDTALGRGFAVSAILGDLWNQRARGNCWLPRDAFPESAKEEKSTSGTPSSGTASGSSSRKPGKTWIPDSTMSVCCLKIAPP